MAGRSALQYQARGFTEFGFKLLLHHGMLSKRSFVPFNRVLSCFSRIFEPAIAPGHNFFNIHLEIIAPTTE